MPSDTGGHSTDVKILLVCSSDLLTKLNIINIHKLDDLKVLTFK